MENLNHKVSEMFENNTFLKKFKLINSNDNIEYVNYISLEIDSNSEENRLSLVPNKRLVSSFKLKDINHVCEMTRNQFKEIQLYNIDPEKSMLKAVLGEVESSISLEIYDLVRSQMIYDILKLSKFQKRIYNLFGYQPEDFYGNDGDDNDSCKRLARKVLSYSNNIQSISRNSDSIIVICPTSMLSHELLSKLPDVKTVERSYSNVKTISFEGSSDNINVFTNFKSTNKDIIIFGINHSEKYLSDDSIVIVHEGENFNIECRELRTDNPSLQTEINIKLCAETIDKKLTSRFIRVHHKKKPIIRKIIDYMFQ